MAYGAADLPTWNANLRTFSRFRKVLKFVPPKIWYNLRRKSGENHDEEESRKNALPELAGTVQGQTSHEGLDRHAPCRQINHPPDGIIRYIQVAVTIATREKFQQETAAFTAIADNYPRYVLTLDDVFVPDRSGVQVINAIDFLAGRADLTR